MARHRNRPHNSKHGCRSRERYIYSLVHTSVIAKSRSKPSMQPNAYSYRHPDRHAYSYRNSYPYCYPHSYSYCYAYNKLDPHTYSSAYPYTNTIQPWRFSRNPVRYYNYEN